MKTDTKNHLQRLLWVVLTAAIAGPTGALVAHQFHSALEPAASTAQQYVCPMHPNVVSDKPGKCPICGMKLVVADTGPSKRSPTTAGLAHVELTEIEQHRIGLQTQLVQRGAVGGAIRTVGRVSVDETRVRRINVKVAGYVERVYVDFEGKSVRSGQPLFSMFSPEVWAAENELLSALKNQSSGMAAAAKKKLELWDVPVSEMQRLEREGVAARTVTFSSPVSGIVTKKDIVQGSRVEAGAMPYEVVDVSMVWALADVHETELRFVEVGASAELKLGAFPGKRFEGKVLFVEPLLDAQTRTARVRLELVNPKGELKPGMFGEVMVAHAPREVLRVPTDAVMRNGVDDVVFVSLGKGHFEPRRVVVGEVGRHFSEVLEGLEDGDAVVVRSNFLLDSESRLRTSLGTAHASHSSGP